MQERRLDIRLSPENHQDIAQPSSTGVIVGRLFRYLVAFVQLIVPTITLLVFWYSGQLTLWPVVLTLLYLGVYAIRFLPTSSKDDEMWWRIGQMTSGMLEITLLGLLHLSYSRLEPGYTATFWWGLYILPVYRMAEVAGTKAWWLSILYASVWLIVGGLFDHSPDAPAAYQVPTIVSQVLLMGLATFISYYILRGWDLTRSASRYWWHLLSEIAARDKNWGADRAVCDVFEVGLRDFIKADWGALWVLEDEGFESGKIEPILELVCCLERTDTYFFQNLLAESKWSMSCEATKIDTRGLAWMKVEPHKVIVQSNRNLVDGNPWDGQSPTLLPPEKVRSRLVARIVEGDDQRTLGFVDLGFNRRVLTDLEWKSVEGHACEFARSLAELYNHIDRVQLNRLKETLTDIEQQPGDEAELVAQSVKALSEYFGRPTTIIKFSTLSDNVETISGNIRPATLDGLERQLIAQGSRIIERESLSCVPNTPDSSQPDVQCSEYFFIYPLMKHQSSIEIIVISDFAPIPRATDHQAMRDAASLLNAMIARRRAANLLNPNLSNAYGPRATRGQLQQLADNIGKETSADVVVIYEFENERPKPPPIYAGELHDPDYLHSKPIVIEDPNPLLRVARGGVPIFTSDIKSSTLANTHGSGLNRHGDPVFVIREGIASSIGMPLKTNNRGVVGVIWLNFRERQGFNQADRQRYSQLFSQLPMQLEQLQSLESARILTEYNLREELRSDWHHHTVQDLFAAGLCIKAAIRDMQADNKDYALSNMQKAAEVLEKAEANARNVYDEINEIPSISGIEHMLRDHVDSLRNSWNLPEEFSADGLGAIPDSLSKDLFFVISEAITNAVKHGHAKTISVLADRTNRMLEVVIRDDGIGFVPSPEKYRNGLKGNQAKIKKLNGKLHIGSKPGFGTGIAVEIPLNDLEVE